MCIRDRYYLIRIIPEICFRFNIKARNCSSSRTVGKVLSFFFYYIDGPSFIFKIIAGEIGAQDIYEKHLQAADQKYDKKQYLCSVHRCSACGSLDNIEHQICCGCSKQQDTHQPCQMCIRDRECGVPL